MIYNPLHPDDLIREICIESTAFTIAEVIHKLGVDRTTFSRLSKPVS